jgi:hypothetical protein
MYKHKFEVVYMSNFTGNIVLLYGRSVESMMLEHDGTVYNLSYEELNRFLDDTNQFTKIGSL